MSTMYQNLWSSVVVSIQELITEINIANPELKVQFIDFEKHAEIKELPDGNLLGPTSFTFTEYEDQMFELDFAVGSSTYLDDVNLFGLRKMVGATFERYRPRKQIPYIGAEDGVQQSVLVITPGTIVAPMTRPDLRPWQYVQAQALLVPLASASA